MGRYLELSGSKLEDLKPVPTPSLGEHSFAEQDHETRGALAPVCAKVVMKILLMARFYQYDLLFAVNHLSRFLTQWTVACEKKLKRLVAYLYCARSFALRAVVGDDLSKCFLAILSDADFAGDLLGSKSTSGCFVAIVGPNTFAPLTAICEMLTVVSHSSTESEIAALDFVLRTEGLPLLMLMQHLTGGIYEGNKHGNKFEGPQAIVFEHNGAVIKMVQKRRFMALKHVLRTHRIAIDWCFENFDSPDERSKYVGVKVQIADLMTKGFSKGDLWDSLVNQAVLVPVVHFGSRAATSCSIPVLTAIAMASSTRSPAGGEPSQPMDNQVRFSHSLAVVTEALAAMLKKREISQIVATTDSKNRGVQLSEVLQDVLNQTSPTTNPETMSPEMAESYDVVNWLMKAKNFGKVRLSGDSILQNKFRPLRVVTDSYGSFGRGSKNNKTRSTELERVSGDVFRPWHIKSTSGGGLESFADHLENTKNANVEKRRPGATAQKGRINEVLVIVWCRNELCQPAGHNQRKTKVINTHVWRQVERLAFVMSQFQYCVLAGPGQGSDWGGAYSRFGTERG